MTRKDKDYDHVSILLFFLVASISCFFVPSSGEVIKIDHSYTLQSVSISIRFQKILIQPHLKMDAAPFNLTFGVELEFIAQYDPEDYQEDLLNAEGILWSELCSPVPYRQYGMLVSRRMIRTLNENGFLTNGQDAPEDSWSTDLSKWTVDTDSSISPVEVEGRYPIELKSPVLDYSSASLTKIEMVVKLLVSKFKLYINESCGLHVHVGNEDRGFTMSTLKEFCSLISVFERQLNSLHPAGRVCNNTAQSTGSAFSPRASFGKKLSIIDKLETVDDVVERFHPNSDKHMAFNLCNLVKTRTDPLRTPFRTIEFRQHRGTLDPELITRWVVVVCNLVEKSHMGCRDLIVKHIHDTKDTGFTVMDLFRDLKILGLAKLTDLYAPLVSRYKTTRDQAVIHDTAWEKEFAPRPPEEL